MLTGRAVEQDFHLADSEIVEQFRGLARKVRSNGVGVQFDTTAHGAAIASDWMSAASFMGVAGILYLKGWFGLGYILGWSLVDGCLPFVMSIGLKLLSRFVPGLVVE